MGRSFKAEWNLDDNTISRVHSAFTIYNKEFYIEDANSKFGTIKKIISPIQISVEKKIAIQVGSFVISFRLIKKFSLFSCFGSRNNSSDDSNVEIKDKIETNEIFLPNNGVHSILSVSKKKYINMIRKHSVMIYENIEDEKSKTENLEEIGRASVRERVSSPV